MTLFPLPVREIAAIGRELGFKVFFDGAHQLGLIAGGQFQDPLAEGADVLTGSAGKTFSGPQSGVMAWNDPELTKPLLDAVFPALAATHQVNRVAALAAAAAELLAFGREYMAAIVANAQALAAALDSRGIPVLGAHKGYTRTHQVIADVRSFGGGLAVAHRLAESNLITNKNLLPDDAPRGLGPPVRPAHRHDRGHAARHGAGRDGGDRRPVRGRARRRPQRQGGGARAARRLPAHPLLLRLEPAERVAVVVVREPLIGHAD